MKDKSLLKDEEGLTNEEHILTSSCSPPRPCDQRYRLHGKSPLVMRILRMSVHPVSHLDIFFYLSCSSSVQKRNPNSPFDPARITDLLSKRASDATSRVVEQKVGRLKEDENDDAEAIQIFYHCMGVSRIEENALDAYIRALEYRPLFMEIRLNATV
ncbi:unnamed protein product [Lactuca saligna]|uniref:Uncharacterized protein n=1 Tax=Lactuca saligna TaxID=75948 RepID=A0AA35VB76_LACSI|nr:unnamed protein product [Lactuca saligna]